MMTKQNQCAVIQRRSAPTSDPPTALLTPAGRAQLLALPPCLVLMLACRCCSSWMNWLSERRGGEEEKRGGHGVRRLSGFLLMDRSMSRLLQLALQYR
jgi:hypothetical protein